MESSSSKSIPSGRGEAPYSFLWALFSPQWPPFRVENLNGAGIILDNPLEHCLLFLKLLFDGLLIQSLPDRVHELLFLREVGGSLDEVVCGTFSEGLPGYILVCWPV
ncbi:MAG: hypothetical protein AB2L14_04285 [Candidatus Xenobiia bacterium LiM19]